MAVPVPSAPALPDAGWGRAAAVAAVTALALHLGMAAAHADAPFFAAAVALMGLGCGWCAVRCLRSPCRSELTALLGMSAAMVGLHVAWSLAGGFGGGMAGMHHASAGGAAAALGAAPGATGTGAGPAASGGGGMDAAMLWLAVAELGVAALCAVALRRGAAATSIRRLPGPGSVRSGEKFGR